MRKRERDDAEEEEEESKMKGDMKIKKKYASARSSAHTIIVAFCDDKKGKIHTHTLTRSYLTNYKWLHRT